MWQSSLILSNPAQKHGKYSSRWSYKAARRSYKEARRSDKEARRSDKEARRSDKEALQGGKDGACLCQIIVLGGMEILYKVRMKNGPENSSEIS